MEIKIEYCGTCNYRPIAAALALAIMSELNIKSLLVHSRDMGALEVFSNGELIFSKIKSERFPEKTEIIDILKSRINAT